MGITGSQQDAVNNLGADYNYNTDKIYLSPIREDENKKMSVDFINLGPIDPFSFLKDMAYGANALVTGAVTGELAEVELDKIALTTLDKTHRRLFRERLLQTYKQHVYLSDTTQFDWLRPLR